MEVNGEVLRLERETCSRCGGSGQYSYCQSYGTTCFKCAGRKEVYTKRGYAAVVFLNELRSRPASAVKVGDTVKAGGCYSYWLKVSEITTDVLRGSSLTNGVMVPYEMPMIVLSGMRKGEKCRMSQPADSAVEVLLSKEEQIATLRQAIEYQNSLTKMGKPMKVKAKAGAR